MKLKAKQIDKLIGGFINIPSINLNSGTSTKIITTSLVTALNTGGFNGTSVTNTRSTNEAEAGLIITGSNNENIVIIDLITGGKILNVDKTVFGKLTWENSNYILTFYSIDSLGVINTFTLTNNYTVTLKIPYRFKLDKLPTDVILKIKQWWLNESSGSSGITGSLSSWEDSIESIESLTTHISGADVGCYNNQSIYEFDALSTDIPDGDFVLKPNDINLINPGRWLKKLAIGITYYNNNNPSTATNFEGIPPGTVFNNKTMQEMWDMLLYPYQYPSFNTFSLNGYLTLEVGVSIPIGNKTFVWSTNNSANINVNSISINGPGFSTVNNLANDGTEIINFTTQVTQNTPGSQTWTITATNSKNQTFNKTYTVNWKWSIYYGESASDSLITSNEILNLRASSLATSPLGTLNYVYAEQKYKYFCYPSDWTDPIGYKRADNGLSVPGIILPDLVSVTKNGVTKQYKVWRSYEKLEGSQSIIAY